MKSRFWLRLDVWYVGLIALFLGIVSTGIGTMHPAIDLKHIVPDPGIMPPQYYPQVYWFLTTVGLLIQFVPSLLAWDFALPFANQELCRFIILSILFILEMWWSKRGITFSIPKKIAMNLGILLFVTFFLAFCYKLYTGDPYHIYDFMW